MGKPITEAVYVRDIQRQALAWNLEFRDGINKGLAQLNEQSTAATKTVQANDSTHNAAIRKTTHNLPS